MKPALTKEELEGILASDEAMPESFTVIEAAYAPESDTLFVKWIDDAEYDSWEDAVADADDKDVARNIQAFKPVERCSAVWKNEDPDSGEKSYSCQVLSKGDLREMTKDLHRLTPACGS